MDERIVSPESTEQEEIIEKSLRNISDKTKSSRSFRFISKRRKIEKKRWIMSSYMVRQA